MEYTRHLTSSSCLTRSYLPQEQILEWRALSAEAHYAVIRSSKMKAQIIGGALRSFKYGVIKYHPLKEGLLKYVTRPMLNSLALVPGRFQNRVKIFPMNGRIPGLPKDWFSNEAELIGQAKAPWATNGALPKKLVLYFPGGGYVAGSPSTHRLLTLPLVEKMDADIGILAVNYRHAPMFNYRESLHDLMVTYIYILEQWGYDPENIMLAGDSAGANLAFLSLQDMLKQGLPLPKAMVGLSGFFDIENVLSRNAKCAFICRHRTKEILQHVFQVGSAQFKENYNPIQIMENISLQGQDFSFYLQTGTQDTFLEESLYLKQIASEMNVDATLDCFDLMGHVFQMFPVSESQQALSAIGRYINHKFIS